MLSVVTIGLMSKEKFWNDMDIRKPKYSDINLSEYQSVHLKIHFDRLGLKQGQPF